MWRASGTKTPFGTFALVAAPEVRSGEFFEGIAGPALPARERAILEDLHWSDDCTLDVIDLLLQRTDPARLLLIGVGRPDTADIRSVIDPAAASGHVNVIELEPLDGDDIGALAADRLGGELPDGLLSITQRRSGGVPLFAEEIVASWLRYGQVEIVDATVRAVDDADALEATIPPTLPHRVAS